jgi:hypothetical protein
VFRPVLKGSGFLTSAAEAGASVLKMAEVSRHRSVGRADLFREHTGDVSISRHQYAPY